MAAVINSPPLFIRKDMQEGTILQKSSVFDGTPIVEDLERAWDNARSFSDKGRPRDMKYLGTVTKEFAKGEREFLFYQDVHKQYWYESRWKNEKK